MNIEETRNRLTATVRPNEVPRIRCLLLTHYRKDLTIDNPCMRVHFVHIARGITGFLMPARGYLEQAYRPHIHRR